MRSNIYSELFDIAYIAYRSCIRSSSSPEFTRIEANISILHEAIQLTCEMLEGDTFSRDHSNRIQTITLSCFETLSPRTSSSRPAPTISPPLLLGSSRQSATDKFEALLKHSQYHEIKGF